MHAVLRVLPFTVASLSATLTLRAQTADLPPIFAPRTVAESPATPVPNTSSLPLSARTRNIMTLAAHSMLTETKSLASPEPRRIPPEYSALASGDTVLMSRYVVKSTSLRSIPIQVSDSPLMNYLKTGTLYHKVYRKVEFRIDLRILPMAQTRRDGGWEFAMPQIGIGLSW